MTTFNFPGLPVSDDRVLLRELNHRINNELAAAIELVSAGAVLAGNAEVKAALSDVVDLLHNYADVHRALMMPVCNVLLDAAEYLRRLGLAMSRSRLDRHRIHFDFAGDTLPLEADRCWRLGLLVRELVANSTRHAGTDDDSEIRIELKRSGILVICAVPDNGLRSAQLGASQDFGLVGALGKSLGGQIEHPSGAGHPSAMLVFPLTEREQRANAPVSWRHRKAIRRRKTPRTSSGSSLAARPLPTTGIAGSHLSQR